MPSSDELAVQLDGVSKRYFLNPVKPFRLSDVASPRALWHRLRPREPFWALRDVTMSVNRGEIVGIIGANGSGKSTLLRVLAGLSPPTTGSVTIHGRYAALLELGAGFHRQATGRENAYLNALFMGLSKREAKERVPEILEFSGLEQFADQPMRTYSAGMFLRLGFSVAIHVQPEIFLIDEILAVGDAEFQKKCFDHFDKLQQRGTTIIIVSHNVDVLKEFASRVVLIEHGKAVLDGDPIEVTREYIERRKESSPEFKQAFRRALLQRWSDEAITTQQEDASETPAQR
ncbi:MAG: ABC transporter ATP-binding protein [Chloroflexi bacterium]|nr:ABC transporter ATP-binding protein [Chloroflexota bacterium]